MKITQKLSILIALSEGKTLTTLDAVREFGTVKLPTRINEWENKLGIYLTREMVKFKTKYGTSGVYYKYSASERDKKKIKKYLSHIN